MHRLPEPEFGGSNPPALHLEPVSVVDESVQVCAPRDRGRRPRMPGPYLFEELRALCEGIAGLVMVAVCAKQPTR